MKDVSNEEDVSFYLSLSFVYLILRILLSFVSRFEDGARMVNNGSFKRYDVCIFLAYTIIVENHLLSRGPRSFKHLNVARFFSRKYQVVLTCFINNVDYMECGILSFKSTSFASALFIVFRFVDLNISRLSVCAVSFVVEIRQSSG